MCSEERMTIDEQRKYLRAMKKRYVRANRKTRAQLLEIVQVTFCKSVQVLPWVVLLLSA